MFSRTWISKSTEGYSQKGERLKAEIQGADASLIGAGSGLSTSAGLTYGGERFLKYFSDFHEKYGITDMYSGGFYPFPSLEEYWAWWSRHIYCNRYDVTPGKPYADLLELVRGRNYFVLTTNVDHQFQLVGFDKARLFYTQGDYGLWQCSKPCCQKTYDNEAAVKRMVAEQENMKIPSELVPHCPVCGAPMSMNLRADDTFVEDEGWHAAARRYADFLSRREGKHILFLELGVGGNTPGIIKYPFWQMTNSFQHAFYVCLNQGEAYAPEEIRKKSVGMNEDIGEVLKEL